MTSPTEAGFTDRELRAATTTARRVAQISRGLVEPGDVLGHLHLWMWKNVDKIEAWREEERPASYLNRALYNQALDYLSSERRYRTGAGAGDFTYYTPAIVAEVLPDVWDHEAWLPSVDPSQPRSTSRPSEGNNRLAILADVSSAVGSLSKDDQAVLRDVYADGGLSWDVLATLWETTESGARKKVGRILDKIVDRLGGPPPWFPAGRSARSNAAAQAEVKE